MTRATAITAALVLAACSSGGGRATPSPTTPATTPAAPAPDPTATAPLTTAAGPAGPGRAPNRTPAPASAVSEWQSAARLALFDAAGTPGAWIAVSDPERGFWAGAIGDAVAGQQPATLGDHGRIGSTTESFAAVAVLQQIAAGKLALTDTVATVRPDIAARFPATAAITVEQLLSMTSGLPDAVTAPNGPMATAPTDPARQWTADDLMAAALASGSVQPPGTPGSSSTNFVILGAILEKVTGRPIDALLTDVARQAGLEQTALAAPVAHDALPDPHSHGYVDPTATATYQSLGATVAAGTDTTDWSAAWAGAAGGMYSTVQDLFDWAASGLGTALLPADVAQARLRTTTTLPGGGGYGLGLAEVRPGWISSDGQAAGWDTVAAYEPATGATFAGIVNSSGGRAVLDAVFDTVFPKS